jgi:hypothetical protein
MPDRRRKRPRDPSTETYERVGEAKRNGRLMDCRLIFPNIEMRLGVGTVKGKWVNIHLLVSPCLKSRFSTDLRAQRGLRGSDVYKPRQWGDSPLCPAHECGFLSRRALLVGGWRLLIVLIGGIAS